VWVAYELVRPLVALVIGPTSLERGEGLLGGVDARDWRQIEAARMKVVVVR